MSLADIAAMAAGDGAGGQRLCQRRRGRGACRERQARGDRVVGPSAALRLPPGQDRSNGSWPPSSTARNVPAAPADRSRSSASSRRPSPPDSRCAASTRWPVNLVALSYNCKRLAQAGEGRGRCWPDRSISTTAQQRRKSPGHRSIRTHSRFRRTSIAPPTDDSQIQHRIPTLKLLGPSQQPLLSVHRGQLSGYVKLPHPIRIWLRRAR